MEEIDTETLFSPVERDQSLDLLQHLLGGIVDFVRTGSDASLGSGTVISDGIGILNVVMLMIVTVIGLYSILSMTADTASDGDFLGRSTDTKYTFLRMGIGGLLLLPVKGGFAVIQLLALYLVTMGVGLADFTWTKFAEGYLRAESYAGVPSINTDEMLNMRGEFGQATYALTAGYLCQLHLNRLGAILGSAGTVTEGTNEFDRVREHTFSSDRTVTRTFEMFFNSPTAARNSNDLCGKVNYSISFVESSGGDLATSEVSTFERQLHAIARDSIYQNTKSVLLNTVRPRARDLAMKIYSGSAESEALRDNAAIATEIRSIATSAANSLYSSRNSAASFSSAEMGAVQASVLDIATERGWLLAPLGQRKLSQIHTMLREYRSELNLNANAEVRPMSLFEAVTRGRSNVTGGGSIDRSLFDPVTRDLSYLTEFQPLLINLYDQDSGETAGFSVNDGEELTNRVSEKVYSYARSWFNTSTETFEDPYVQFTNTGYDLTFLGGILAGGSALLEGVASVFQLGDIAGTIVGPVSFAGKYLLIIGIIFMIIIPFIPIAYYIGGLLSWLAVVLEAMFALPIALAVWFLPAREPSLIGPWQKVVLSLFSLLLRPFFMVVGLVICVLLLWVGLAILNLFFSPLLSVLAPKSGLMSLITILGLIGLYAMASIMVALHSASMITMLGDEALSWIGAFAGRFTTDNIGSRMNAKTESMSPVPHGGPAIASLGGVNTIGKQTGKQIKGLLSK